MTDEITSEPDTKALRAEKSYIEIESPVLKLSLTANLFLLQLLLFLQVTTPLDLLEMTSGFYMWATAYLTLAVSLLFGLAVVQILSDDRARASWLDWGRVLIGTFLSLASVGCPGCGAPLLRRSVSRTD